MKYFNDCKTCEDVKKALREYAKKLHPDLGGDGEEFKQMMNEYEVVFNRLKNIHTNSEGETFTKETTETPQEFADIINKIIHFEGCTIEIIGSWVWVSGNTYEYREQLKELHFFYSKNKKAWYNNGNETKTHRKGHYTLEQIKEKYGVTEVETKQKIKAIA